MKIQINYPLNSVNVLNELSSTTVSTKIYFLLNQYSVHHETCIVRILYTGCNLTHWNGNREEIRMEDDATEV